MPGSRKDDNDETEYLNTGEYEPHKMKMVHIMVHIMAPQIVGSNFPHEYTTLISIIKPASKYVGFPSADFHKSLLCL